MIDLEPIYDFIRREISRALSRSQRSGSGTVTSYDGKRHAVKVKLQPDGIETGWIPVRTMQSGNAFGLHIAPNIDDPVSIDFHEQDREAGTIIGAFFTDKHKPVEIKAGEFYFKHKNGTETYFKDDGTYYVKTKDGSEFQLKPDGNVFMKPKDGKYIFLGGDGVQGAYDFVGTLSGPSINVKARIS